MTIPFSVQAAFWKLAQARPADILGFKAVTVEEAQAMARTLTRLCSDDALV